MKEIALDRLLAGIAVTDRTDPVTAVVTDSRKAGSGSVFVAIKGERADGHDYAAKTVEAGAVCVLAQHPVEGVPAEKLVLIEDPLAAMIAMGTNYRAMFSPTLIGVTGSVGKTTTKEFCAAVFSAFGETLKTEGNQNNELGVPNTLFRLADTTQYAVVEMGMDRMGDIRKLTGAAKPHAAVISRIGVSHIEHLGSRENILAAKLEICESMAPGGVVVLNGDDDLLRDAPLPEGLQRVLFAIENENADVRAVDIVTGADGERFTIKDRLYGERRAFIPAVGLHNISNALSAYAAATRLGLDADRAVAAFLDYRTTGMRQHITEKAGITVIEDCYNANPDSMAAGISALATLAAAKGGRRVAVLGDMLELGAISDEAHRTVGVQAAQKGVDILYCFGPRSRLTVQAAKEAGIACAVWCETKEQAAQLLFDTCKAGDTLLFKASRGMALEEIFNTFYRLLDEAGK